MKPMKGFAHPINVPCRRCKVPAGEDCHTIVCGLRCPEREYDNALRIAKMHNAVPVTPNDPDSAEPVE